MALGGVASGGGSNGAGVGGIWHVGMLDLPNTLVTNNLASTANNDIF
jgi:hypothetical protein